MTLRNETNPVMRPAMLGVIGHLVGYRDSFASIAYHHHRVAAMDAAIMLFRSRSRQYLFQFGSKLRWQLLYGRNEGPQRDWVPEKILQ